MTCAILVVLLGLNVSILGLVFIPGSAISLIAKIFGLILLLNLVYLAIFSNPCRSRLSMDSSK